MNRPDSIVIIDFNAVGAVHLRPPPPRHALHSHNEHGGGAVDAMPILAYHTTMSDQHNNQQHDQAIDPLTVGELKTLKDLGEEGPLSYESLRKYARSGKLRARRLGYQWFSTRAAIDIYLKNRQRERAPNKIYND